MDILLLVSKVRDLVAAVTARDWVAVFTVSVAILTLVGELIVPRSGGTVQKMSATPELKAACADLETCLNSPAPMGADLIGVSPGTLLGLARLVLSLVKSLFGI